MTLPPRLARTVEVFRSAPRQFRTEALVDYSKRVPPLPPDLVEHPDRLEQVHECQTPFFLATRIEDGRVRLFFDAPAESPTIRAFAGILFEGLDGEPPDVILEVPDDFFYQMGLEEIVSPLRLRGMAAILARIKRRVRAELAA